MVMAREMPRLSQMKGVLAPFPLPGAPFSHTTSSGACNFCRPQDSSTVSAAAVQMPENDQRAVRLMRCTSPEAAAGC